MGQNQSRLNRAKVTLLGRRGGVAAEAAGHQRALPGLWRVQPVEVAHVLAAAGLAETRTPPPSSACSTTCRRSSSASACNSAALAHRARPTHCANVDRTIWWPARSKLCSSRYSARWSINFATSTCASRLVMRMPLSMMMCGGTGARMIFSQQWHTHLLGTWRSTVNTPGW